MQDGHSEVVLLQMKAESKRLCDTVVGEFHIKCEIRYQ